MCEKAKKIFEKAEKRKTVSDTKEKELGIDKNKLNEEYELSERMLEDAKKIRYSC